MRNAQFSALTIFSLSFIKCHMLHTDNNDNNNFDQHEPYQLQNEKKSSSKKSPTASSASLSTTTTTASSSAVSIKDNLIDNKEKLNDLNDQILNSQQNRPHHHHHHHNHQVVVQRSCSNAVDRQNSLSSHDFRSNFNPSYQKTESIMSSDSDIRFTRKKLGDNQRCGCIIITGFLVMLLVAGLILCE